MLHCVKLLHTDVWIIKIKVIMFLEELAMISFSWCVNVNITVLSLLDMWHHIGKYESQFTS